MPKTDNNEKLRKAAKGLGLGLLSVFATIGIVATIACLARCGESPKQEASAEDASEASALLTRKDAPVIDEGADVFGDNVRYYSSVQSAVSYVGGSLTMRFSYESGSQSFFFRFPSAGLYYVDVGNDPASSSWAAAVIDFDGSRSSLAELHMESVEADHSATASLSLPDNRVQIAYNGIERLHYYVNVSEADVANYAIYGRSKVWSGAPLFRVYAVDMMQASPTDRVSLPEDWKPYELIDCVPKQNGFGVCNPRTSASLSPTGQGVVKGLLFRSNGKIYNRLEILPWSPYADDDSNTPAHTFGYYDASGRLVWKTFGGDYNDMIIYRVTFSFVSSDLPNFNGTSATWSDVGAYCPETSVIVEQQARVVYLSAGPLTWNSPLFRELEVLDVYDEQIKPTDTLLARSPLEWLRLSLADVNPSTPTTDVGIQDGMTLVSDGIVAFMPILGIEVLPSISLGLLLILPLIGGIIVLIVKVFSK